MDVLVSIGFNNTLGALFIGFGVACCIYGILLSQVYTYFVNYPQDRPIYKLVVLVILTLETADQIFIGQIYYYYGISNFANVLVLLSANQTWAFILQQLLGAVVGSIVKMAFALRVWRFSEHNFWITGLIMFLSLGGLALALVFSVKSFMLPNVFAVIDLQVLGTVSLGVGVLTDMVTAAALCYFLSRLRTGHRQSDSLVSSLIRYAINTGAVTSVISVTTVILYNTMPSNLIFVAVYFILSKLYAISFMATLNTRRVVRGKGTDRQGTATNHTNLFHLGTRVPTMGPADMEGWEAAYSQTSAKEFRDRSSFPMNSFAPPTLGKAYV